MFAELFEFRAVGAVGGVDYELTFGLVSEVRTEDFEFHISFCSSGYWPFDVSTVSDMRVSVNSISRFIFRPNSLGAIRVFISAVSELGR